MATMRAALILLLPSAFSSIIPGVLPKWEPTYEMRKSTAIMPCNQVSNNQTGSDNAFFAQFGIADFDWSNLKQIWASIKPMNCEEMLAETALITKKLNPDMHVWVYRNSVKALPWFTSVREKLEDKRYWGWFLSNKNCTNEKKEYLCGDQATNNLYHDFLQTPGYAGSMFCNGSCDCGVGVECGEYLFDLRNDTLQEWMVNEYILSPTGLGSPSISGFFFDDGWDSVNGPSEEDASSVAAIGFDSSDLIEMTTAWKKTITAMLNKVIDLKGFAWQLFLESNSIGRDESNPQSNCSEWIRSYCGPNSSILKQPLFFPFTRNTHKSPFPLPAFDQDLATFLLVRGEYAWIGYSWLGLGCHDIQWEYRDALKADYGVPLNFCSETSLNSGVFTRDYTNAKITMDCNNWRAEIKTKVSEI